MAVEDDDARERGDVSTCNVKVGPACWQRRFEKVVRLAGQESAQRSLLDRLKRVRRVGICLARVVDAADTVVEDDQAATARGRRRHGGRHGLVEVGAAIGGHVRVGTHGTGDDERLGAVQRQVDPEGSLLERVGPVDHDGCDNVGAWRVQLAVDVLCNVHEDGGVHARAAAGGRNRGKCQLGYRQHGRNIAYELIEGRANTTTIGNVVYAAPVGGRH